MPVSGCFGAHRPAGGALGADQPDVGRHHQGQLAKHALPVEATLSEAAHGRLTRLREGGESSVRVQRLGSSHRGCLLGLEPIAISLALRELVSGQGQGRDRGERQHEHPDDRHRRDAGASRTALAAPLLRWDQIDGTHR